MGKDRREMGARMAEHSQEGVDPFQGEVALSCQVEEVHILCP